MIALVDGVVVMRGEIDVTVVDAWSDRHLERLVVRVMHGAGVTYLGSVGLRFVLRLARDIAPERLVLRRPTRAMLRTLELTGVAGLVDYDFRDDPGG